MNRDQVMKLADQHGVRKFVAKPQRGQSIPHCVVIGSQEDFMCFVQSVRDEQITRCVTLVTDCLGKEIDPLRLVESMRELRSAP